MGGYEAATGCDIFGRQVSPADRVLGALPFVASAAGGALHAAGGVIGGLGTVGKLAEEAEAAEGAITAAERPHIDFISTPGGDVVIVPQGATGPLPTNKGTGFQYTGGRGGFGLDPRVSEVRVMDPVAPKGNSPGYPNGYVSYSNSHWQGVSPYSGQPIANADPWRHIRLH